MTGTYTISSFFSRGHEFSCLGKSGNAVILNSASHVAWDERQVQLQPAIGFSNFLLELASNHDTSNLSLPRTYYYRCEPLDPGSSSLFKKQSKTFLSVYITCTSVFLWPFHICLQYIFFRFISTSLIPLPLTQNDFDRLQCFFFI
jgi:hypothetical protein